MIDIKIYYWTEQVIHDGKHEILIFGKANLNDLNTYYVNVYDEPLNINMDNDNILNDLFELFNSETENPLSSIEYQNKIKQYHTHTSMSVGDIIKLNNDYYVVAIRGFTKL